MSAETTSKFGCRVRLMGPQADKALRCSVALQSSAQLQARHAPGRVVWTMRGYEAMSSEPIPRLSKSAIKRQ